MAQARKESRDVLLGFKQDEILQHACTSRQCTGKKRDQGLAKITPRDNTPRAVMDGVLGGGCRHEFLGMVRAAGRGRICIVNRDTSML